MAGGAEHDALIGHTSTEDMMRMFATQLPASRACEGTPTDVTVSDALLKRRGPFLVLVVVRVSHSFALN